MMPTHMRAWILPAFGTFILWGIWGFLPKLTTQYISPRSAIVYEVLGGMVVALIVLLGLKFRPEFHPKGFALALTTGMLGFLGALCYLSAVWKGPVSLVVILTALYPMITILLALLILKEPITIKQWVGMALGVFAMVLIASK